MYIEYDETDCNGTKVHAMLVGGLSSSSYHAPYLIQIQTTHHAANAQFVQQFILSGLAKLGLMDDFNKVKLFLTDGAAYNIAASKLLKNIFSRNVSRHMCVSLLSSHCSKISRSLLGCK